MDQTSEEILCQLNSSPESAFKYLYRETYPTVERYVIKNSGTVEDARDVFQETLIILLGKLKRGNLELTASLKTYFVSISKNLWLKDLRKSRFQNKTSLSILDLSKISLEAEITIIKEKSYWDRLQDYLTKVSSHCNRLLRLMFFRSKTIEDVRLEFGYSSRHNLQNQKYKCIQQLRKLSQEDKK